MNVGGWIMLGVSWSIITCVTAYAVIKTLRVPSGELSAPLELEAEIEEAESRAEDED